MSAQYDGGAPPALDTACPGREHKATPRGQNRPILP
jgi:hypothetical protein